eukprot:CAMPEP_0172505404 /NCGR_PEP_ID=MMETSP1066-20121228/186186_1 /TAXON_ID=671091 /ORGANISM="Coscinodiscus wailesii, Strain CCMP2513" /LENGTH=329 /DNA_ID=CAMNT_0013282001 /DNA_START=69 /DNA_END=1058 /DNA_ORIENTATION=+
MTSTPTLAALPPLSQSPYSNPPFASSDEYDKYLNSISPPRELVCPITQEVLYDPVVAEDGYTYERKSLLRWFSMGRTRSPVTNSIMTGRNVFPNLAVQGIARAHRERLGTELLHRCHHICDTGGCEDNGSRIAALLDSGADITLRHPESGDTALLMLIRAREIDLCKLMLQNELHHTESVLVTLQNSVGETCVGLAEDIFRNESGRQKKEWEDLLILLKKKMEMEERNVEEREGQRRRNNEEHRERQRTLAETERANGPNAMFGVNHRGLGQMQDHGWGYFPSLAALQFQGAIPPPSASIAEYEEKAKKHLNRILYTVGIIALIIFLFT